MSEKIYTFEIPVTGREVIEVKATSYAEAVKKVVNCEVDETYVPETDWSEEITEQTLHHYYMGDKDDITIRLTNVRDKKKLKEWVEG